MSGPPTSTMSATEERPTDSRASHTNAGMSMSNAEVVPPHASPPASPAENTSKPEKNENPPLGTIQKINESTVAEEKRKTEASKE